MPTRVARLLTATLVVVAVLLPAAGAAAASGDVAVRGELVLAAEGGGEGEEPPGLEVRSAEDSENEFAPADYEANFLWGAAVGLLFLSLLIVGGLGAAWYWLVVRPSQTPTRS